MVIKSILRQVQRWQWRTPFVWNWTASHNIKSVSNQWSFHITAWKELAESRFRMYRREAPPCRPWHWSRSHHSTFVSGHCVWRSASKGEEGLFLHYVVDHLNFIVAFETSKQEVQNGKSSCQKIMFNSLCQDHGDGEHHPPENTQPPKAFYWDLLSFNSIERKQKLELDRMLVGLLLSHPKIETTFIETDFSPHQQLPCFRIWPLQVLDQSKMCRTCCFVKACHGDFCFEFNFERFQDKKEFPAGSEGLACDRAFTSFYHWILPLKSMKPNPCLKLLAGTRRNRATAKCKAKAAAKNRAKALKATKEKSAKKAQLKRPAGAKTKAKTKGKQLKQDYNNVYSRCYHAKRKAGFSNEEAPFVFCDFSLPPFFSLDFCKARDAARGAAHAACRSWGAGWRFCGQLALAQLKKAAVRWQCNQPITSSGSWTLSPTDYNLEVLVAFGQSTKPLGKSFIVRTPLGPSTQKVYFANREIFETRGMAHQRWMDFMKSPLSGFLCLNT